MTIYLRNNKNETFLDVEASAKDVHASVIIEPYSWLLLQTFTSNPKRVDMLINSFQSFAELRGWFWENYMEHHDNPTEHEIVSSIKEKLQDVCKEFELHIVTD